MAKENSSEPLILTAADLQPLLGKVHHRPKAKFLRAVIALLRRNSISSEASKNFFRQALKSGDIDDTFYRSLTGLIKQKRLGEILPDHLRKRGQ